VISCDGSGLAQPPDGRGTGRDATALLQRGQLAVLAMLILLTVGAWGLTIIQARSMPGLTGAIAEPAAPADPTDTMGDMTAAGDMGAMPDSPGTANPGMADMAGPGWQLGGLAAFVVAWAIMMAAMMLPAVTPMLLLYRTIAGKSMSTNTAFVSTWILVSGYLLVWTVVGVGVYALTGLGVELAGRSGLAGHERWASIVLGAILVVAGLYQFTPLKHACLRQCQSPFGFIMGHWRGGTIGALRMGIVHGLYCLGCCWALFAVLVAAGVMSLAWMLLLTLVVFAEKVLPMGRRTAYGVGAAFLVLGIVVASGRIAMPGMV
jgi:predicted metal-binding membrane protein